MKSKIQNKQTNTHANKQTKILKNILKKSNKQRVKLILLRSFGRD